MDYKAAYDKIMNSSPKIRFCTICDMSGEITYTGHREGTKNILTAEESKNSLQMAVNSWKSRNDLSAKIGEGNYVLAAYDKIKRITIPLDSEHLIYLTTEVDADHTKIIDETLGLRQG